MGLKMINEFASDNLGDAEDVFRFLDDNHVISKIECDEFHPNYMMVRISMEGSYKVTNLFQFFEDLINCINQFISLSNMRLHELRIRKKPRRDLYRQSYKLDIFEYGNVARYNDNPKININGWEPTLRDKVNVNLYPDDDLTVIIYFESTEIKKSKISKFTDFMKKIF